MKTENIFELKNQGYTIIRNLIDDNWLDKLRVALDETFIKHRQTQVANNNDIQTGGRWVWGYGRPLPLGDRK